MKVLEHNDVIISDNLRNSKYPDFYEKDYKGLGLFSICERDIQYIITSSLYRYYKIWPEYVGAYKNSQRLDIGLHYASEADSDGCIEPDVAIELKWAGFNKNGQLYSNSQQSLVASINK